MCFTVLGWMQQHYRNRNIAFYCQSIIYFQLVHIVLRQSISTSTFVQMTTIKDNKKRQDIGDYPIRHLRWWDDASPCSVFAVFLPSRGLHLYAHVFGVIDGLGCKGTHTHGLLSSTSTIMDNYIILLYQRQYQRRYYRHTLFVLRRWRVTAIRENGQPWNSSSLLEDRRLSPTLYGGHDVRTCPYLLYVHSAYT